MTCTCSGKIYDLRYEIGKLLGMVDNNLVSELFNRSSKTYKFLTWLDCAMHFVYHGLDLMIDKGDFCNIEEIQVAILLIDNALIDFPNVNMFDRYRKKYLEVIKWYLESVLPDFIELDARMCEECKNIKKEVI